MPKDTRKREYPTAIPCSDGFCQIPQEILDALPELLKRKSPLIGRVKEGETVKKWNTRTVYNPDWMPSVAYSILACGYSRRYVASVFGASQNTLLGWYKTHSDFRDALDAGEEAARAWWEDKARDSMTTPKDDPLKIDPIMFKKVYKIRFGVQDKVEEIKAISEMVEEDLTRETIMEVIRSMSPGDSPA